MQTDNAYEETASIFCQAVLPRLPYPVRIVDAAAYHYVAGEDESRQQLFDLSGLLLECGQRVEPVSAQSR